VPEAEKGGAEAELRKEELKRSYSTSKWLKTPRVLKLTPGF
jgi:hypothetical protein